jgi:spore coat protein CotH
MIELFIDHRYEGLYEICENVDANTVGLNSYNSNDSNHSVLYKAWGNEAGFSSLAHLSYEQKEPHVKYGNHWKPYEDLINFLGTAPREVFEREVESIIDIENVIDFQIILNFAFNTDGTNHNLFIARNNGKEDRFFIIPWDYDKSLGGAHNKILSNHLIDRLMHELPNYKTRLNTRWQELRKGPLSEEALMERIDELENRIRDSAIRNYKIRPLPEPETHESHVKKLREWIRRRLTFMDQWMKNLEISKN